MARVRMPSDASHNLNSMKSGSILRTKTKDFKNEPQEIIIKTLEKTKINYESGNPLAEVEQRDF